jgi:hypothetical protein
LLFIIHLTGGGPTQFRITCKRTSFPDSVLLFLLFLFFPHKLFCLLHLKFWAMKMSKHETAEPVGWLMRREREREREERERERKGEREIERK